jgi:hypothetical protein
VGSAVAGLILPALFRRRSRILRALAGIAGSALVARAVAGHCGVKSALAGQTGLAQGLRDQWNCLSRLGRQSEPTGLPGSPAHHQLSGAIDEAVEQSFPASDPPASRLPDEPPSNAADKWRAAQTPRTR